MKATTSLTVRRSPEEVFAFVSSPANMASWLSGVSASEAASEGPVGPGAVLSSHYTHGSKTHLVTYVVTAYEEGRRYGFRATSGPYPFENLVELEPAVGGTRVIHTIDAGADSRATAVIFAVFGPILRKMMRRRIQEDLKGLKVLLEQDGVAAEG